MKKIPKKFFIIPSVIIVLIAIFVIVADNYILPNYVYAPEVIVPDNVGKNAADAIELLMQLKLNPIVDGSRFDAKFPKDHVIFQRPHAGTKVKVNRRIYLIVSGGNPKIKMPSLIGKTLRDGKITIERLGLNVADVNKVRSEFPAGHIVRQEEIEGMLMSVGDTVHLEVSVGPNVGKSRVPNLLGQTLKAAEKLLRRYSLNLGEVKYMPSKTLLPNTIWQQYPNEGTLLSYGDSVSVYVYKIIKSD